jgi:DNA modification methylase
MPKVTSVPNILPFWTTTDGEMVKLYSGHVVNVLNELPSLSIHTVVTSPPYWGLRDYGTGQWEGGAQDCDHRKIVNGSTEHIRREGYKDAFRNGSGRSNHEQEPDLKSDGRCRRCGAKRTDQQIGSEPSPDCGTQGKAQCGQCFVCVMVKVFKAVRRVLRNDGTLWLNLGDCYGDGGNLMGMPWRVALALQQNGWILRSDIPWVKRNPMPESATNRPCKALEYVFLLVKDSGYYFDMEAIKPEGTGRRQVEFRCGGVYTNNQSYDNDAVITPKSAEEYKDTSGRNFRNADPWYESMSTPWGMCGVGDELVGLDVTTQGYPGAHYATFGERLIRPLIKASTSEKGCCAKCGRQWVRIIKPDARTAEAQANARNGEDWYARSFDNSHKMSRGKTGAKSENGYKSTYETIGWQPSCECNGRFVRKKVKVLRPVSLEGTEDEVNDRDRSVARNRNGKSGSLDGKERPMQEVEEVQEVYIPKIPLEDHPITPAVVLDPFIGSGTTCAVSIMEGRHSIGIDLNEKYLTNNAIVRIRGVLLDRPAYRRLAGLKEGGKAKPGIPC